ncbi:hypothetical protein VTO42DRAFT_7803 [Malbranchea cinnamomea]
MSNPGGLTGQPPSVLVVSLDDPGWLHDMYKSLFTSLSKHASLKHAEKAREVVEHLNYHHPNAVIVTDPGIREPKNSTALAKLKEYLSNGGTAIFACMFSSFIRPPDFTAFFRTQFCLPWEFGDYCRTTVHLNPVAAANLKSTHSLPKAYSQKAVFLRNAKVDEALYLPTSESRLESHVFPPERVSEAQPAVGWAKVGNGWIGYVGDVNGEEGSNGVILGMCGF